VFRPAGKRTGGPGRRPPSKGAGGGQAGSQKRDLGRLGEEAAAAYLAEKGYVILARNFRCRLGEIDIVARQGRTVAFVEVRTRTTDAFGLPEESIDARKRARLKRLAAYYLYIHGLSEVDCRFDVVAITADPTGKVRRIELLADAFS